MTKTITFLGKTYSQDLIPAHSGVQSIPLTGLNGSQLLELHNLVVSNLGATGRVNRFSDTKAALRRTWGILEKYEAEFTNAVGEAPGGAAPQEAPKQEPKQAAPATTTGERWRTPKSRPASRRCYAPRPGSKQAVAYGLLTRKGGIGVEEFCREMNKAIPDNKVPWEPANTWGSLNYLFVTQKGYGLKFDGERIELLIGTEEVPFTNARA